MPWTDENGNAVCSDCNWKLQGYTANFTRRHYTALAEVISATIDELENSNLSKARAEASAEAIAKFVDVFCNYAQSDNINFKENIFRNAISSLRV